MGVIFLKVVNKKNRNCLYFFILKIELKYKKSLTIVFFLYIALCH